MELNEVSYEAPVKVNDREKKVMVLEAMKKEIIRGLFIFWLVSTVFLFLRIFLKALGSDPQSAFAAFVYFISNIFLLPFWGIFPNMQETAIAGEPMFDASAITAIFCYTILVGLAISVTLIVMKMLKTGKQVNATLETNRSLDATKAEKVVQ